MGGGGGALRGEVFEGIGVGSGAGCGGLLSVRAYQAESASIGEAQVRLVTALSRHKPVVGFLRKSVYPLGVQTVCPGFGGGVQR